MAKPAKYSQEQVLTLAAKNVAETINPKPNNIVLETFQKHFKEKAAELLSFKNALLLTIGPCVTTDGNGIYSKDIRAIVDYVEEKMKMKFNFDYGILMFISKDEIYSIFLPH